MKQRTRTKESFRMVEGLPEMRVDAQMGMDEVEGWEMLPGHRVPVVVVDPSGNYWWRGNRKLLEVSKGVRVSLDGVTFTPVECEVEFHGGEVVRVAKVDLGAVPLEGVKFALPYPMDSKADAARLWVTGWDANASPVAIARRMGWKGAAGPLVAAEVLKLVAVMRLEKEADKFPERRERLQRFVRLPGDVVKHERVKPGGGIAELRAELERVNEKIQRVNDEIRRLWEAMI